MEIEEAMVEEELDGWRLGATLEELQGYKCGHKAMPEIGG